jgi:hypothetical protein
MSGEQENGGKGSSGGGGNNRITVGNERKKFPQMQRRQGVLPMPRKRGGRERSVSERQRKKQGEEIKGLPKGRSPQAQRHG